MRIAIHLFTREFPSLVGISSVPGRGCAGQIPMPLRRTLLGMTAISVRSAPAVVQLSVVLWLAAIGAGAAEALVHLLLPQPPTLGQLAARFGIYAVLTVLVLGLRTGHNAVRWTVAVLLGGFGTASLVVEPVSWLLAGGTPGLFLVTAQAPALVAAALRLAHLVAVFSALVLLFRPAANAWFRR
jgi:hypothetical protein